MHCKLHHITIVIYVIELQSVGCDNVLESEAQKDSCGVCNGDDSSATRINDTLTGSGGFGYHTVTVIPTGAHSIRIAEATASPYIHLGKLL